jgi:hypothetical protein
MTDEQKFLFDVRGWLLLPAVLPPEQCAAIRDHLYAGGRPFEGPAQELVDHPVVVDVLEELLAEWPSGEKHYNFRCENAFVTIRKAGWKPGPTDVPHVVTPPQYAGAMRYQVDNGKIYSALTRVVWELNPVRKGDGGTLFLPGSHKARMPYPEIVRQPDNEHLEGYECPAGSVFVFTESLLHAATAWTNEEVDRCAIFYCYNSLWAQWHRLNLDHELIMRMPEKRRSLFRGVYAHDFTKPPKEGGNREYSETNRSL